MEKFFVELAERFQSGTVNLSIQMDKGTMAVMVTFKGLDVKPRVLKGTPAEIDESFITNLESDLKLVSKYNEDSSDLEAAIAEKLKEKQKKLEDDKATKAAAEKKKADKTEASKSQTSLLDQPKEEKVATPVEKDASSEEKVATPEPEKLDTGDKNPTGDSSLKIPFRISSKDRGIILDRLMAEAKEIFHVHDIGTKVLMELKKCAKEEAEEAFRRSDIPKQWFDDTRKKPESEPITDAVEEEPETEQDHTKNVEALKAELDKPVDDFDDDFDLGPEPAKETVPFVADEDDDFEL